MKKLFLFDKSSKGEGYVPNNLIFAYASGLAGQNLTYFYITNWLKYFYINILHVDPMKISTVFSASYVWDAVNDPLVGAYIDKRKYKPYRKLRPFLLYTPPIIGLLSTMMFVNTGFKEGGMIVYLVFIYFLWDLVYSFQDVGLWGMIALASPHSEERARISQWVSIGAGAGSAVVGLFQQIRSMLLGIFLSQKTMRRNRECPRTVRKEIQPFDRKYSFFRPYNRCSFQRSMRFVPSVRGQAKSAREKSAAASDCGAERLWTAKAPHAFLRLPRPVRERAPRSVK
mgnify:CR=1 FL=1